MNRFSLAARCLISVGVVASLAGCDPHEAPIDFYNVTYSIAVTGTATVTSIQLQNQNALALNEFGTFIPSSQYPTVGKPFVYTVANTRYWLGFKVKGTAPKFGDSIVVTVVEKNVKATREDGAGYSNKYSMSVVDQTWTEYK